MADIMYIIAAVVFFALVVFACACMEDSARIDGSSLRNVPHRGVSDDNTAVTVMLVMTSQPPPSVDCSTSPCDCSGGGSCDGGGSGCG